MTNAADTFLNLICASNADSRPLPRALLVVAHPDDEAVGIGAHLLRLRNAVLVGVTDGSPFNLYDAHRYGFASREEYAEARRQERANALALAGIGTEAVRELACPDQEAAYDLPDMTRRLADLIAAESPDLILTHPYEGGHPDHDATAFLVHAACRLREKEGIAPPTVVEMASYHNGPHGIETGTFLPSNAPEANPNGAAGEVACILTETEQAFKRRLFDAYATQQETLNLFSLQTERFRPAPVYDFSRPPHEGQLFYEGFHWNMDGAKFRVLACEALSALGLAEEPCL